MSGGPSARSLAGRSPSGPTIRYSSRTSECSASGRRTVPNGCSPILRKSTLTMTGRGGQLACYASGPIAECSACQSYDALLFPPTRRQKGKMRLTRSSPHMRPGRPSGRPMFPPMPSVRRSTRSGRLPPIARTPTRDSRSVTGNLTGCDNTPEVERKRSADYGGGKVAVLAHLWACAYPRQVVHSLVNERWVRGCGESIQSAEQTHSLGG